jgi:hypothetical protein
VNVWIAQPEEHTAVTTPPTRSPQRGLRILAEDGIDLGDFLTYRDRIPARGHVVYVMSRADGLALYIGQTRHPRTRLHTHWRKQPWWPEVRSLELHSVADEIAARELELDLHGERDPLHSQVQMPEVFRLQSLRDRSAPRPAGAGGGGLRHDDEPLVVLRVSRLTDTRLSVLARLVDAWLSSLGGDDVPAAGTTAAVLGCSPDEVQAAYGELFTVGRLRHEDDAAAGGTR